MPDSGGGAERGLDELVAAQRDAFRARFGAAPAVVASAPGRINVIGEHTDYNDGLALPGAIDRWVVVALAPREAGVIRAHSEAFAETLELAQDTAADTHGWGALIAGVAATFAGLGERPPGFDALIGGNLPMGAGVSSSAAVEMALLNALRAIMAPEIDDLDLVRIAQRAEHRYLGVATGIMDQYTSQFAKRDALLLIDFESLTHEETPGRLDGWSWVLIDSGVRHSLADSAYGDRVAESRKALASLAPAAEPSFFRRVLMREAEELDDPLLRRRLRHYVSENDRVRRAAAALAAGDAVEIGRLLLASHTSLRDDYAVSCDELDLLVDAAARHDACAGARMMGGGFGGCTLNLVRRDAVAAMATAVGEDLRRRFGRTPSAAAYRLVAGATAHE